MLGNDLLYRVYYKLGNIQCVLTAGHYVQKLGTKLNASVLTVCDNYFAHSLQHKAENINSFLLQKQHLQKS